MFLVFEAQVEGIDGRDEYCLLNYDRGATEWVH